ncbi:MAG: methyl-accepting chemotaxis protein [Oleispira sp.]|jgi:methyl-accepting chemotaxis protein
MFWYHNLLLKWKLIIPLSILIGFNLVATVTSISLQSSLADKAKVLGNSYLKEVDLILQSDRDLYQAQMAERSLLLLDKDSALYSEQMNKIKDNNAQVKERFNKSVAVSQYVSKDARLREFRGFISAWNQKSVALAERSLSGTKGDENLISESYGKNQQAFDDLRDMLDKVGEERLMEANKFIIDIEKSASAAQNTVLILLVLSIGLGLMLAFTLPNLISGPINKITEQLKDISQGEGDLTKRLNVRQQDEVGKLASFFDEFMDKLQSIVGKVQNVSHSVGESASDLRRVSEQNHSTINEQNLAIHSVVTAVEEMSSAAKEVAANTAETADQAKQANDSSDIGVKTIDNTIARIERLSTELDEASKTIATVEQEASNVNSVLDVIRGIAEQTNLLALNAAIEAARAGEQGRGFAVVADEVRTLASRTQDSTQDIQRMLEGLQQGVKSSVDAISASVETARETVESASITGQSLSDVKKIIDSISQMTVQVASAVEEQSQVVDEINKNLNAIGEYSNDVASGAETATRSCLTLDELSESLMSEVNSFRV